MCDVRIYTPSHGYVFVCTIEYKDCQSDIKLFVLCRYREIMKSWMSGTIRHDMVVKLLCLGSQIKESRQLIYDEESPLSVNNEIVTRNNTE